MPTNDRIVQSIHPSTQPRVDQTEESEFSFDFFPGASLTQSLIRMRRMCDSILVWSATVLILYTNARYSIVLMATQIPFSMKFGEICHCSGSRITDGRENSKLLFAFSLHFNPRGELNHPSNRGRVCETIAHRASCLSMVHRCRWSDCSNVTKGKFIDSGFKREIRPPINHWQNQTISHASMRHSTDYSMVYSLQRFKRYRSTPLVLKCLTSGEGLTINFPHRIDRY